MSIFNYNRRKSSTVRVGHIIIGGDNPVRVQSMTNTSALDTNGSIEQILRIVEKGGELVRLTTQGEREASNMKNIKEGVRSKNSNVPLVADVHFNPKAAFKAAEYCEKVRINPGNFVDAARTFVKLEYTDEEYALEIEKIRSRLLPFLEICKRNSTAIRLGVNHGSLSDRIMSRYGDTPEGMVESVLEFLRICREVDFNDIVISIKASNTIVMTETVRLLDRKMREESMSYPLHLGVTEAGDGEDGRIKSAIGIGTLLCEGLGDTIRVSLSEAPENEIPVAILLRDYITSREGHSPIVEPDILFPFPLRKYSVPFKGMNKYDYPLVADADFCLSESGYIEADASKELLPADTRVPILLSSAHINAPGEIASWIERFYNSGGRAPIIIKLSYSDTDIEKIQTKSGADFGMLLLHGYGDAILLDAPALSQKERNQISFAILQGTRLRFTKTEYIACPGCGRTLFDLQTTLRNVKKATEKMKGLKIGVMGCIVNGPGEMADADYGYVGAGPGKVSIYRGKELIIKNIPTEEALDELLKLIAEDHRDLS